MPGGTFESPGTCTAPYRGTLASHPQDRGTMAFLSASTVGHHSPICKSKPRRRAIPKAAR